MQEITRRSIRKTLAFEKDGQAFAVTIDIENARPDTKCETIIMLLDTLFNEAKEDFKSGNFNP